MKLHIPKESPEVKKWMVWVESQTQNTPNIKWDALNVWYGNKLPKYLWDEWKDKLKPEGFTWQIFLKLIRHRTDKVVLWNKGILKWEELIRDFIDLIKGPFGKEILSQYKKK